MYKTLINKNDNSFGVIGMDGNIWISSLPKLMSGDITEEKIIEYVKTSEGVDITSQLDNYKLTEVTLNISN